MAVLGIAVGLFLGALAPWPVAALIGASQTILPAAPIPAIYPIPLLRAAAFGAVIAALFAWWPLLRARRIPAALLLADVEGERASPISPLAWAILAALVAAVPGAAVEDDAPMVRGRVVAIAGRAADSAAVDPAVRWVLAGNRGFTAAVLPPRGADIVAGRWWGESPDRPLVSVEKGVADGLGLRIGDTVGVNILGREIAATVANLRAVRWTSLAMNFAFVFFPGVIDGAPHTRIAAAKVLPAGELALERAVADALPNVSAIRLADVLERVQGLSDVGGRAILAVTGVTLLAGLLVLGARRRDLMWATPWESLSIRLVVGGFAVAAGASPDGRWCVT